MKLLVQKLHPKACMPSYAHATDAGMDLYALSEVVIEPRERVQVSTGLAFAIPEGYVGLIWDKSGLSHKSGLKTLGGVVDAGYRGEVLVGLVNLSTTRYVVRAGDKVAQMLIQKVTQPVLEEVDALDSTDRGNCGFGSTGT